MHLRKTALAAVALFLCSAAAQAHEDVVFKALKDEMDRSMKELKIKGHDGPYFLSYTVTGKEITRVSASFGALTERSFERDRDLGLSLRVGNYDLDSSRNYSGSFLSGLLASIGSSGGASSVSVDNDYQSIRHALWLRTDEAYKGALEQLEAKKAYLLQNIIKDKPPDFSKEQPVVSMEKHDKIECDSHAWAARVRQLSAVFKDYPKIDKSLVLFGLDNIHRWFLNSEGSKTFISHPEYVLALLASTRACDGTIISDSDIFVTTQESQFPSHAQLDKRAKTLADSLSQSAQAPLIEAYDGPVLFEGLAAGEFFSQVLSPNLVNPKEPLGSGLAASMMASNPLKDKIGQRVLPTFISVVDDPLAVDFKGSKLFGGLAVDEEGVPSQKLTLVDKGILKTFCSSRTPSRYVQKSNGHARHGGASTTNLFILPETTSSRNELYGKLRELGKEEGLKHVLVVRRLQNPFCAFLNPKAILAGLMGQMRGRGAFNLLPPALVYQIDVESGNESLVRSTPFTGLGLNTLKDIVAAGDDSAAYPIFRPAGTRGLGALSVVSPSIIVKELETQKSERDTERGPILPNPYFEKKASVK